MSAPPDWNKYLTRKVKYDGTFKSEYDTATKSIFKMWGNEEKCGGSLITSVNSDTVSNIRTPSISHSISFDD